VLAIGTVALLLAPRAMGGCGCMDIAFVIDDSGSMGGAIDNIKGELPSIISAAQFASGGDLRLGLISFPGHGTGDEVWVRQQLTTDAAAVAAAIQALTAAGGGGEAEPSDVALQYAVTGSTSPSSCVVSNPPFGTFRPNCVKIAVLVTDAHPGECTDTYAPGVSDVYADNVAGQAADAGVLVSPVYVPTGGEDLTIRAIMENYAEVTGGIFTETDADGTGAAEGVLNVIASCGTASTQCITRNSQYWFSHAIPEGGSETNCANILNAITANGGYINLGFVRLPVTYENSDNLLDQFDATMEALGFNYKSKSFTGEGGGSQNSRLKGSSLCKARKRLSAELIAATANVRLLGTRPNNCSYKNGGVVTNFPANLLQLARAAASGTDPIACNQMTALLRKFNNSGVNNNLPGNLVECSPNSKNTLKQIARDPTTQLTCPGLNDNCATPEEVYFQSKTPPFSKAKFNRGVNLYNYSGALAYWSIGPSTAVTGRTFRVSTYGGTFDTTINIYTNGCTLVSSNGVTVVNTNGLVLAETSTGSNFLTEVSFTADGISTNLIEVGVAPNNTPSNFKIKITSP
jgi:hypothetical protein